MTDLADHLRDRAEKAEAERDSWRDDFDSCEHDLARLVIAVLDGSDDEALRLAKEAEGNGRPGWLRKALQGNGPTKDRRTTEGRERDEARAVIAAAVAALSGRSTGDLAADVAGLLELAGRDQSAEIADLRDSLDRLRAKVEACGLACRYHAPPSSCGFCPVCRLRAEVSRAE